MSKRKWYAKALYLVFALALIIGLAGIPAVGADDPVEVNTLRVYGRCNATAEFPYTNPEAPFRVDVSNTEMPPKDFVVFDPAFMWHGDENAHNQFGTFFQGAIWADGDASEKVHLRMWYVPKLDEPVGETYYPVPEDEKVSNYELNGMGDIVLEYTYIMVKPTDPLDDPPAPTHGSAGSTKMVFPMAGLGGQVGLDRYDVNGDLIPEAMSIDKIEPVMGDTTLGEICVSAVPTSPAGMKLAVGQSVQFFDYMVTLNNISGNNACVGISYIGNRILDYLGEVTLSYAPGDDAALVGRYFTPTIEVDDRVTIEGAAIAVNRPFWVTLDSISPTEVKLIPHRILRAGESFFVDGAEYDVSAIYILNDPDGAVDELKYITLRNPLPKGEGTIEIAPLTIWKERIAAGESLWMLPPFNYVHDIFDDTGPEWCGEWWEDIGAYDGDLLICWLEEDKEERFDTNLLEEKFTGVNETWQWINIETLPWDYTEFVLPDLVTVLGVPVTPPGDYILVSSFIEQGDERAMFLHDTALGKVWSADIYVNDADYNTEHFGVAENSLRVYGCHYTATFPYDEYTDPFDITSENATEKDFVVFNPAFMWHGDPDAHEQFGSYFMSAIKAEGDASEKTHLRLWYTCDLLEPVGETFPVLADEEKITTDDIVLEYTYILVDPTTFDPTHGAANATSMVFPMAGLDGQVGLDRYDVNGDGIPEKMSFDGVDPTSPPAPTTKGIIDVSAKPTSLEGMRVYPANPAQNAVQFFDYMVTVDSISGDNVDVSIHYIGSRIETYMGSTTLTYGAGANDAALVGRYFSPPIAVSTRALAETNATPVSRPFWVTVDSVAADYVTLTPHRILKAGETFFTDGAEYDIAAIYLTTSSPDGELKYITLRNPLPKGEGNILIPTLTVWKEMIPAEESLWMLPPFNYIHDMIDDINIPDDWQGESNYPVYPDKQLPDNPGEDLDPGYNTIRERWIEDVDPLDGVLQIYWLDEYYEPRFHGWLAEILDEPDNVWDCIEFETMPDEYTEFVLPELPDIVGTGDYILVGSWDTEDAVRMKFVYDAADGTGIYVNTKTVPECPLQGDVNMDGNVNSGDITKLERIILTLDVETLCADVNGDGNINSGDITMIELIMLGLA